MQRLLPVLALLPILSVSTPAVMAQQPGAQCTAIVVDADRLACFDAAFASTATQAGDASVVFESEQPIPARPSGRAPATITVACDANVLSVAFGFAGNALSALGRDAGITWQLDLQARSSRTLPVDATNTALLINNTRDSLAFLQSLNGANNLTVRVTPATARSLSVRFQLDGFAEQVAPVLGACGS